MLANVGYTMQKCLPMSKLKFKRVSPVSIRKIVIWTIVALFLFGVLYNTILTVPDRVYSAQELKNLTVGTVSPKEC
jgi:hypothetical protein